MARGMFFINFFVLLTSSSLAVFAAAGGGKLVVLFGAPASGKGTVATKLHKDFGFSSIVTSDLLNNFIDKNKDTKEGVQLKKDMKEGNLISDQFVLDLMKKELENSGDKKILLDGFPRTVAQGEGLQKMLKELNSKIDMVIEFEVDNKILLERALGRWVHKPSGRSYHNIYKKPKVPGKDDVTGEDLIQRADDTELTVKKRLETYKETTFKLIPFYKPQGLLRKVDASKGPQEVYEQVAKLLGLSPVVAKLNKFLKGAAPLAA